MVNDLKAQRAVVVLASASLTRSEATAQYGFSHTIWVDPSLDQRILERLRRGSEPVHVFDSNQDPVYGCDQAHRSSLGVALEKGGFLYCDHSPPVCQDGMRQILPRELMSFSGRDLVVE